MEGKTEEMILDSFADLKEDWDSYGASPISQVAIDRAKEALNVLRGLTYHIAPLPDGGVQLEWKSEHYYLEVVVEEDGEIHFFARQQNLSRSGEVTHGR